MNSDEGFQLRWEFRRREIDGDTSSDNNGSNSSGESAEKTRNLVTDLVLLENEEENYALGCQRQGKLDTYDSVYSHTVKADKKKVKSSKKKKVVQKKSEGRTVKEIKRKRKLSSNEVVMLKDLKIFADSLIHELTAARENMFAYMREEMGKLVASRSNLELTKKNVKHSRKKKVYPQDGIETGVKPQVKATKSELHNGDRLRLSPLVHMNLAYGSDQAVSSSQVPLPALLPKPQLQNQRNLIHLDDHIPLGVPMNNSRSEMEIGKLTAAKKYPHRIAEFEPEERFGSFSQSYHKSFGLLCQSSSQTAVQDIGFPIPLNQGTENGSNTSSLTYCENSLVNNNIVGLRMNGGIARFPRRSSVSSQRMIPDSIISNTPH